MWVKMIDLAKWDSELRPEGFIALVPIPKRKVGGGVIDASRPSFGLGPWIGARVGSHRCPILRPGQRAL